MNKQRYGLARKEHGNAINGNFSWSTLCFKSTDTDKREAIQNV